jgi:hypothetical protein
MGTTVAAEATALAEAIAPAEELKPVFTQLLSAPQAEMLAYLEAAFGVAPAAPAVAPASDNAPRLRSMRHPAATEPSRLEAHYPDIHAAYVQFKAAGRQRTCLLMLSALDRFLRIGVRVGEPPPSADDFLRPRTEVIDLTEEAVDLTEERERDPEAVQARRPRRCGCCCPAARVRRPALRRRCTSWRARAAWCGTWTRRRRRKRTRAQTVRGLARRRLPRRRA